MWHIRFWLHADCDLCLCVYVCVGVCKYMFVILDMEPGIMRMYLAGTDGHGHRHGHMPNHRYRHSHSTRYILKKDLHARMYLAGTDGYGRDFYWNKVHT